LAPYFDVPPQILYPFTWKSFLHDLLFYANPHNNSFNNFEKSMQFIAANFFLSITELMSTKSIRKP
jgi:hypothetical protein